MSKVSKAPPSSQASSLSKVLTCEIQKDSAGLRLDKSIQQALKPQVLLSVKQVKSFIESQQVTSKSRTRFRSSDLAIDGESFQIRLSQDEFERLSVTQVKTSSKLNKQSFFWNQVWKKAQDLLAQHTFHLDLIYCDSSLLVVNKPSGLPTAPTIDPFRESVYHHCLAWLASQSLTFAQQVPYLRCIHRLDRDTSGLVVFSRTPKSTKDWSQHFQERRLDKRYRVICHIPTHGPFYDYFSVLLNRAQQHKQELRHLSQASPFRFEAQMKALKTVKPTMWTLTQVDGLYSCTEFSILAQFKKHLVIEAKLLTGRTHQIRVHLSSLNAPVLGDLLYGTAHETINRLMLHAHTLSFTQVYSESMSEHESSNLDTTFTAPLPKLFKEFDI